MVKAYNLKNSVIFKDSSLENYNFYVLKKNLEFFHDSTLIDTDIEIGAYFQRSISESNEIMSFEIGDVLRISRYLNLDTKIDNVYVVQIKRIQYNSSGRHAVLTISHI